MVANAAPRSWLFGALGISILIAWTALGHP